MRRKYKLPLIIIEQKDKNDKNEITNFLKKIHIGYLISASVVWGILFFLVPYFMYYKFLPTDVYLINSNLVFMLIVVVSFFLFLMGLPVFLLYLSFDTYLQLKDTISKRNLVISMAIATFFIAILGFWGLYKKQEDCKTYLWFIVILITLGFIYYFSLFLLTKIINKKIKLENNKNNKSKFEIFFMLFGSYFAFILFLILFPYIITYLFLIYDIKDVTTYIFVLIGFTLVFYLLVLFFLALERLKNKVLFLLTLVLIIPLFLVITFTKGYINMLYNFYSHFGLTSNKNIVLITEEIYKNLLLPVLKEKKSKISECKTIAVKTITVKDHTDFICLEDIKIIWNGKKMIFIEIGDNLSIPIPKSSLFNESFIRKINLQNSDTSTN